MSFDYKRINLTIIDQLRSICEGSTDQWADKDNLAVDMIIEAINIARGYARLEKKKVGPSGLKEILKALGMSQNELAKRSGLTPAAISQIVKGQRDPALSSIVAILNVLPVTFERLIGTP